MGCWRIRQIRQLLQDINESTFCIATLISVYYIGKSKGTFFPCDVIILIMVIHRMLRDWSSLVLFVSHIYSDSSHH